MIDLLGFPEPSENVRWYVGSADRTDTGTWEVWTKPRGCTMLSMIAISSGAGGGGGAGNVAGSTAGGGEGGGSSGISRMLFPLWLLPDTLYVYVRAGGVGGAGGSSGNGSSGTGGALSYVCVWPNTTAGNQLLSSGAAAPAGGQQGTTAAAGTSAGQAGTAAAATTAPLGQMALTQAFVAGIAGANGGTSGAGVSITPGTGVPILPGCGGGGKTTGAGSAGGGYVAVASTQLLAIPGGVSVSGGVGSPGFYHPTAGYIYGGCGGGGSNTQAGGNGGACGPTAYGAGGGGGGGGLTTGGRGGDGGPGLIIMACW